MVLHQVGNSISMKVQFNPVEYHSLHSIVGGSAGSGAGSRVGQDLRRRNQEEEEEEEEDDSSDDSHSGKLKPNIVFNSQSTFFSVYLLFLLKEKNNFC